MKTASLPVRRPKLDAPPAPLPIPAAWWRTLLFLALVAVPAGIIIHLISVYAVDVPFWDQWETARFFSVTRYGRESLVELARQQNESRLLFPNLLFLALSLPGNWSVVREMYTEVLLVAAIAGAIFQLLRRTGFSLPVQAAVLFPINWMLFSLSQHENWFFGIQICYCLPPLMLCLALLANGSGRSPGWKTAVSLGLAFVSSYSFSGGVLVCALAFPGWLPANWSASGGWLPNRRELTWHAVYILACAAMLTFYFWGYLEPAGAGSLTYIFSNLGVSLSYFFVWMGSPFAPHGPLGLTMDIGIAAFVGLGTLLGTAVWQVRRDRDGQRRLYPWVVLSAYAVGTGLATVVGRSGFGTAQALSSRYIIFSNFTYIAILGLAVYLWCFHRRRLAAGLRTGVLAVALALLAVAGWTFARVQLISMPWIEDGSRYRQFAAQGLTFLPIIPSGQNLDSLCGVPDFIRQHAMDLIRRHVLEVPMASKTLAAAVQKVAPRGDSAFGALDQPDYDASGRVSIRGWAVNPALREPAGSVLITCTGRDKVTHPVLVLLTNLPRPAGAPAAGEYQKTRCGFMGLASFDRLEPGEYTVAAWTVDLRLNRANQIGETYPFKWARAGTLAKGTATLSFPPLDPEMSNRSGCLEEAKIENGNLLVVKGWALDLNSGTVPKTVLITCTDPAGQTQVVGQVGPSRKRADMVDQFRNDSLIYCGYEARADLGKLPPGDYRVAAWSVSVDVGETPWQQSSLLLIHLPPR